MDSSQANVANLLDLDPDLAEDLDAGAADEARSRLRVRIQSLASAPSRRTWGPADPRGHMGLLIVEGLLLQRMTIDGASSADVVGPQDLIRPWDHDGGLGLPAGGSIRWAILRECRVAVLDPAFVRRATAWPEVVSALAARGVWRAQALALHRAIGGMPLEKRIPVLLQHLAGRFGRVGPKGLILDIPLTHAALALLLGARRPSVTMALGRLRRQGLVEAREDRTWLLTHEAANGSSAHAPSGSFPLAMAG